MNNVAFNMRHEPNDSEYQLSDISQPKAASREKALTIADVVKRAVRTSSIDLAEQSSHKFAEVAHDIGRLEPQQSSASIISTVEKMTQYVAELLSALDSINMLPAASKDRPEVIGACLYPIVARLWAKSPPSGAETNLINLALKYLETGDPDRQKELKMKDWLASELPMMSVQCMAKDLPNAEYYVRLSMEQSGKVEQIDQESSEIEARLGKIKEMNDRSRAKGKEPLYENQEGIIVEELRKSRSHVAGLFDQVSDVSPLAAANALAQLQIKVAPAPALMTEVLRMINSVEKLLLACVYSHKKLDAVTLAVPEIKSNKLITRELTVSQQEFQAIAANGKLVAQILDQFIQMRASLRALVQVSDTSSAYTSEIKAKVNECLTTPFSRFSKSVTDPFVRMIANKSPEIRAACCALLAEPVVVSSASGTWGYVLEKPENHLALKAAIGEYLSADLKDNQSAATKAISASPITERNIMGLTAKVRNLVGRNRLGDLGIFFDDIIEKELKSSEFFSSLGLLYVLNHFAQDELLRVYVRQQIPRITEIKGIAENLGKENEDLGVAMRELSHLILRALSQSLDDYYMDESGGDLKDLIENYRFFLANPDIFKGITGNEAMRNSIVIYGEPGVGKTHLVNCLKNELNVDLYALSAAQKESGQDRLDYTKGVIKRVKEKKKPCILLIDEAESTVLDRVSPTATSEDRECTNYLLQEIDELRRSFPYVFIILATNYIERVDDAMLRPGRVDLEFEMKLTSAKGRETIIRQCLNREKIKIELTSDDMKQLVEMTEGFIPIRLIQTITETNRVYLPRLLVSEPDLEFDKELLFERFKLEGARLKRQRERIEKKGNL